VSARTLVKEIQQLLRIVKIAIGHSYNEKEKVALKDVCT
jgi:hypothetical protein